MLRWKASLKPTSGGGGGSAPVYDAYADGAVSNGSSIPSFNLNVGSGGNAAVIVSVRSEASTATPAADITVTVGGVSATLISGATGSDQGFAKNHLFGVAIGAATGNQAIVVSWTSGNAFNHAVASSFTGVDQTTPFDNGNGRAIGFGATSSTLSITSATGDLTFSDVGEKGGVHETVTVNNTTRYNLLGGDGRAVGSTAAGAASVDHIATISTGSSRGVHVGCNLNAVSASNVILEERFEESDSGGALGSSTDGYDSSLVSSEVTTTGSVIDPDESTTRVLSGSKSLEIDSASGDNYVEFDLGSDYDELWFHVEINRGTSTVSNRTVLKFFDQAGTASDFLKGNGSNKPTMGGASTTTDGFTYNDFTAVDHFWMHWVKNSSSTFYWGKNSATRPTSGDNVVSFTAANVSIGKFQIGIFNRSGNHRYDDIIVSTSEIGDDP